MTIAGNLTNHGTLRLVGGAIFDASGATTFLNDGVLDLITAGASALPATFVNGPNGLVLTANSVQVKSAARSGETITLTIDGYTGHAYQLQRSSGLATASFTNVGTAQIGSTGSTLSFVDSSATALEAFYRVVVNP